MRPELRWWLRDVWDGFVGVVVNVAVVVGALVVLYLWVAVLFG
jgi:hypothetical protein